MPQPVLWVKRKDIGKATFLIPRRVLCVDREDTELVALDLGWWVRLGLGKGTERVEVSWYCDNPRTSRV
jgi:hypothetical protein